uniref:Uncharacterized protein n=1 Tax=Siphoviridae sp. ctLqe90 TaxID=2825456 RepID=A0A8S5Q3V2_9CAUD|nr:MAG TPA: hypothetical protein [Siphoviridae sp. ctLqe90]
MIDGVNLITTETVCISCGFLSSLILAIVGVIDCIVLIVMLVSCVKDGEIPTFVCSLGLIILLGVISCIGFDGVFNPKYEERYLVQLNDKISSKFIDKYEIVERKDNNVYVIKERDADD